MVYQKGLTHNNLLQRLILGLQVFEITNVIRFPASEHALPRVDRVFANSMVLTDYTDGGTASNRIQDLHKLLITNTRLFHLDRYLGI